MSEVENRYKEVHKVLREMSKENMKSVLLKCHEYMTKTFGGVETIYFPDMEKFVVIKFGDSHEIAMQPKEILKQLLWYRDNKSDVISEYYHKQDSNTDL